MNEVVFHGDDNEEEEVNIEQVIISVSVTTRDMGLLGRKT